VPQLMREGGVRRSTAYLRRGGLLLEGQDCLRGRERTVDKRKSWEGSQKQEERKPKEGRHRTFFKLHQRETRGGGVGTSLIGQKRGGGKERGGGKGKEGYAFLSKAGGDLFGNRC